jgi:hypothetical protein
LAFPKAATVKDLLTLKEAARAADVHTETIRHWCNSYGIGELTPNGFRVDAEKLAEHLKGFTRTRHKNPPREPEAPGAHANSTGPTAAEAAEIAARNQGALQEVILKALEKLGQATPEEICQAARVGDHAPLLTSVRSLCSRLRKAGVICPSGSFGTGESGVARSLRYKIAPPLPPEPETPDADQVEA